MGISSSRGGFTLVEVVLVIVILAIGLFLSILYYQTTQVRTDLNAQVSDFVGLARVAESNAEAGKGDLNYGVHFASDRYVIFQGNSYDPNSPSNYEVVLPSTIVIQNISLNGGGSDVVFASPRGATTNYGTVQFSSSQISKTITITVTQVGNINY